MTITDDRPLHDTLCLVLSLLYWLLLSEGKHILPRLSPGSPNISLTLRVYIIRGFILRLFNCMKYPGRISIKDYRMMIWFSNRHIPSRWVLKAESWLKKIRLWPQLNLPNGWNNTKFAIFLKGFALAPKASYKQRWIFRGNSMLHWPFRGSH